MHKIIELDTTNAGLVDRLAAITHNAFTLHSPEWVPSLELAREEVLAAGTTGRFGRVCLDGETVVGWIGIIKGDHVWEIHPIAVHMDQHRRGVGRLLVEEVAAIAKKSGALTLFAGISDETGNTNLFGTDLYNDPIAAMQDIESFATSPLPFWQNLGFTVVGLMPDEEGKGKPGIHLARRL
ncbi:MAG: GNAT family N-acetyltransferase [Woeseiaceae bacterium]